MITTLRSEFRKLLTVRSTYITSVLAILLVILVSFYVEGWQGISGSAASELTPEALREVAVNSATTSVVFSAIVAILFMAHEYRHNLIMYTLTISNSRTKVLLAKIVTVMVYAFGLTVLCGAIGIGTYYLGLSLRDASLPAQSFDLLYVAGRVLFYGVCYGLIGLLFAALLRNVVAAVAAVFILPVTVEPLLGLILKDNSVYLPFASLEQVIVLDPNQTVVSGQLSPGKGAFVFLVYLVAGWLITWLLFLRRDAS